MPTPLLLLLLNVVDDNVPSAADDDWWLCWIGGETGYSFNSAADTLLLGLCSSNVITAQLIS